MEPTPPSDLPALPPGEGSLRLQHPDLGEPPRHRVQRSVLIETLQAWPAAPPLFVGGAMRVHYATQQPPSAPDVFVVLDAEPRHGRTSWVVWNEHGMRPDVVIELVSPATERAARGEKMRVAELWRAATYVIYDPFDHRLDVHALDRVGGYRRVPPRAFGDVPVPRLGLSLGLRDGDAGGEPGPFLRWIDRDGKPLPTDRERADAALARVAELEAELARRS